MREKILNLSYFNLLKIVFFISVFTVLALIFYFPNYAKLKKLRETNRSLLIQMKKLNTEIKDLQKKIKQVDKDPYLYEKIARDNLGVAKENEIVVDIEE
jgi:cell division protein FtsB